MGQTIFFIESFILGNTIEERRAHLAEICERDIFAIVNGRDLSFMEYPLRFHNGNGPQLWIESPDGVVVAGVPVSGFTYAERALLPAPVYPKPHIRVWQAVLDWETGPKSNVELLVAPINLQEGDFYFCYVYPGMQSPFSYTYFPWGGESSFWR